MKVPVTCVCQECDAEAKIITLFLRNTYCGRYCLAEGQLKLARWLSRLKAEEVEHG